MKNVSREVVLATPIPWPSLAEQFHIITRINELRSICGDLGVSLETSAAVIEKASIGLILQG